MSIFNNENMINNLDYSVYDNLNNNIIDDDEEEKYEPLEPLKYNFTALNQLNTNNNFIIPDAVKDIYVLGYRVNSEKKCPFLEYLLLKTQKGLDFIKIGKMYDISIESLVSLIDTNLVVLLFGLYSNENNSDFVECYKGFKMYDGKLYLFFDLTSKNIQLIDIYRTNGLWFCLVDEIVNTGKLCDIDISQNTKQFFIYSSIENHKYYHLYDDNNNLYEVPKVVYVGRNKQNLVFTYTFGVSKDTKTSIVGPYYYFTDFKNAIKQGSKNESKTTSEKYGYILQESELKEDIGGIIRFAIFLGKTKLKTNSLNEHDDLSDVKKEKLSVENEYTNYERMTIRITDYDGKWANDYDTVILEDIQLDDYVKVKNTPMYVCKEYEQQVSLSYHYINKKSICDGYDSSNSDYLIL